MSLFPTTRTALFVFSTVFFIFGCGPSGESIAEEGVGPVVDMTDEQEALFEVKDTDAWRGDEDAPVTVIEYASVTCSHCGAFHKATFDNDSSEDDILNKYIETGKVRLVLREFLTPPAELSLSGFYLARCAKAAYGNEGYFKIVDTLFEDQARWIATKTDSLGRNVLDYETSKSEFARIVRGANMTAPEVSACVANVDTFLSRAEAADRNKEGIEDIYALFEEISANIDEVGEVYDITGTPGFIVNGEKARIANIESFDGAVSKFLPTETESLPSE